MAEYKKLLISGANAEVKELYVSDMSTTTSDLNVVVRNASTGRLFITGTYSNAGTPPNFPGSFNGNMDLTVDAGSTAERYIALGEGRTSDGDANFEMYCANGGPVSFAIRRQEGLNGSSSIEHSGTNDFIFRLLDGSTNSFIFRNADGDNCLRLQANGRIYAYNLRQEASANTLLYNPSSDEIVFTVGGSTRRVKTNIQNLDKSMLDNFNKLRPVTYNYIKDPKETYGGFIAEELDQIDPSLVEYGLNYPVTEQGELDFKAEPIDDQIVPNDIKDRTILALIVAKIQELDKKIEELKKLKENGSI